MKRNFFFLSGAVLGLVLSLGMLYTASTVRAVGTGSNIVSATQCTQRADGVLIRKYGRQYLLKDGCRNAGHGMRDYTLTCAGQNYRVRWESCDAGVQEPVAPPQSDTDPVLSLSKRSEVITVGDAFEYPIATARDREDGNLTRSIRRSGNVNPNRPGRYVVTYRVTDSDRNTVSQTFTLTVNAAQPVNTPPVLTLSKYNTTLTLDGVYVPPRVSAIDAEDGNITNRVVRGGQTPVEDEIGLFASGTYVETYTVTDSDGSRVSRRHTINVVPPADCGENGFFHNNAALGDHCHCDAGFLPHPDELMCITAQDFVRLHS